MPPKKSTNSKSAKQKERTCKPKNSEMMALKKLTKPKGEGEKHEEEQCRDTIVDTTISLPVDVSETAVERIGSLPVSANLNPLAEPFKSENVTKPFEKKTIGCNLIPKSNLVIMDEMSDKYQMDLKDPHYIIDEHRQDEITTSNFEDNMTSEDDENIANWMQEQQGYDIDHSNMIRLDLSEHTLDSFQDSQFSEESYSHGGLLPYHEYEDQENFIKTVTRTVNLINDLSEGQYFRLESIEEGLLIKLVRREGFDNNRNSSKYLLKIDQDNETSFINEFKNENKTMRQTESVSSSDSESDDDASVVNSRVILSKEKCYIDIDEPFQYTTSALIKVKTSLHENGVTRKMITEYISSGLNNHEKDFQSEDIGLFRIKACNPNAPILRSYSKSIHKAVTKFVLS